MTTIPTAPLDVRRIHAAVQAMNGKELNALAKRAGIGRTTLYNLRANPARTSVRVGTLARLQAALGITPDED